MPVRRSKEASQLRSAYLVALWGEEGTAERKDEEQSLRSALVEFEEATTERGFWWEVVREKLECDAYRRFERATANA
mgnify:CR=1 FL=1|tara:strand:- start:815 stop:1045 length:231 start_codon:yes stop_codon:yes gene_type:complete